MAKMYGKGKSAIESEEQQRLRWQVELEFVQCLANPNYLNFLAQRGYFKDQCFINYLHYLQYWKEPEYAKYLMYPMALYFLDLLQYEPFRREIVNSQCCKFIDDQTILQWQHYTRKRMKLFSTHNTNNSLTGTGQNNHLMITGGEQQQQQMGINDQQQQQLISGNGAQNASLQNGINNNNNSNNNMNNNLSLQQQQQQLNGIAGHGVGGSSNSGHLHKHM